MRWRFFLVLALIAGPASARLYQWVDPSTGHVYMSGSPPAWYRTGSSGPRVLVFENGKLIDDTRREATADELQALREQAVADDQRRKEAAAGHPQGEAGAQAPEEDAASPAEGPADASAEARSQAEAAFANYLKTLVSDYFRSGTPPPLPAAPMPAQ